jgi:hypothetical protein
VVGYHRFGGSCYGKIPSFRSSEDLAVVGYQSFGGLYCGSVRTFQRTFLR